jgi:hypothetical protein
LIFFRARNFYKELQIVKQNYVHRFFLAQDAIIGINMGERMKLTVNKNTYWAFLSAVLFKATLDLVYYLMAARLVGDYIRLSEISINWIKITESYGLLALIFVLMPRQKSLSRFIIWLLVFISYIPLLTVFGFMDQPRAYVYAATFFWIIIFALLRFLPRVALPPIKEGQAKIIRYGLYSFLGGTVFFLIMFYLGMSFNLNLLKVYDIRAIYTEADIPLAGYLFNWFAYILNPLFFAIFLRNKKWPLAGGAAFFQFLLFSVTGNKTFLFAFPFVIFLMWLVKRKNPVFWLGLSFSLIAVAGLLSYLLVGDVWTYSLFARRLFLLPARLSFFYYDFFSSGGFIYLSDHSLFGAVFNYPYALDPAHLICQTYLGRDCNANNGLYSDAFMNFGFAGFIIWGIAIAILLKMFDSASRNKELLVGIAAVAMPIISFNESVLLTALFTHGILLSLAMVYLLPKDG